MYDIQLAKPGGGSVTVKSGDTFLLPCNYTVTSFTDATGAPGQLNGVPFNSSVPRYAASTKTWTIGSQTWSDVINIPECDHDAFTNSLTVAYCRSYTTSEKKYYYYNWVYVNANQNTLCPSPWHVPTKDDFMVLDKAFNGGTGANRTVALSWITEHYINEWGASLSTGRAGGSDSATNAVPFATYTGFYWSQGNVADPASSTHLLIVTDGRCYPACYSPPEAGMPVRCVK
jgi:uncharacterized protein (TIGR02145 family)